MMLLLLLLLPLWGGLAAAAAAAMSCAVVFVTQQRVRFVGDVARGKIFLNSTRSVLRRQCGEREDLF
jgi:hypothetical protein